MQYTSIPLHCHVQLNEAVVFKESCFICLADPNYKTRNLMYL